MVLKESFDNLNKKVVNNHIIRFLYKIKTYFDVGEAQISWFTGKLPEVNAVVNMSAIFGILLGFKWLVVISLFVFILITCFGLFFRKSGLYVVRRQVETRIDPVMKEIYDAAKKINERFK